MIAPRLRIASLVSLVLAAGCRCASEAECNAEVVTLESRLSTIHESAPAAPGLALVKLAAGAPTQSRRPVLTVLDGGVLFEGARVELAQLPELFEAQRRRASKSRESLGIPDVPLELGFEIDGRARWETIVALWEAAGRGPFGRAAFAFEDPAAGAAPSPSKRHEAIVTASKREEPAARREALVRLAREAVDGCDPAENKVDSLLGAGRGAVEPLLRALPGAVRECRCRVDAPSLVESLWFAFGGGGGARRNFSAEATIAKGPEGALVSLAAGTPWSEAAPQVVDAIRKAGEAPLRFVTTSP